MAIIVGQVLVTSVRITYDSCIFTMITVVPCPTTMLAGENAGLIPNAIYIIHVYGASSTAKVNECLRNGYAIWITKHIADNWGFRVIKTVITDGPPVARSKAYFNSSTVKMCIISTTPQTDVQGIWGWWKARLVSWLNHSINAHCASKTILSEKSYNYGFFCFFEQYWSVRACN